MRDLLRLCENAEISVGSAAPNPVRGPSVLDDIPHCDETRCAFIRRSKHAPSPEENPVILPHDRGVNGF